jgi:nucleoside-diphosphate-sugar epimerase
MRIAVVGAGAVGGYFGARLAQGGAELVVVARGEHLAAIRREGLRVRSVAGDALVRPTEATDDPGSVAPVEAALLGVKSWQVPAAAPRSRRCSGRGMRPPAAERRGGAGQIDRASAGPRPRRILPDSQPGHAPERSATPASSPT